MMLIQIQESLIDDYIVLPDWMPEQEKIKIIQEWSETLIELRFLG